MNICVDFDGTCVKNAFPSAGAEIGAVPVLKELVANGHNLILWTMRSDMLNTQSDDSDIIIIEGQHLQTAVNWFKSHDIPLYGIQVNPTQSTWTTSPKAYCDFYIDDRSIGCPLIRPVNEDAYVDWKEVKKILTGLKLI